MLRAVHGSVYRGRCCGRLVVAVGQPLFLCRLMMIVGGDGTVEGPLATPDDGLIVNIRELAKRRVDDVGFIEPWTQRRVLAVPLDAAQSASTLRQLVANIGALALATIALLGAAVLASLVARTQAAALLRLAGGQVLLLVLDSTILKPDFHLLLRQAQIRGDLDATQTRQVHVGGEFTLELEQLGAGEGGADALGAVGEGVWRLWRRRWGAAVSRWRFVWR